MANTAPKVNYLSDYQPPNFAIGSVYLEFDLQPLATRVTNRMLLTRMAAGALHLDGENLQLISVTLDGLEVTNQCLIDENGLQLMTDKDQFELVVVTEIAPQSNTALEGLYRTSNNYCTQCEAEGFRKITYYLDRPDVLSVFTTKIIADKSENRYLLANGNMVESGDLADGKHYAVWLDPHKKPCYLFALVAGNLEKITDTYTTVEGREVRLEIFVEPRNIDKCDHAMQSLKRSMQWDEQRFGLIYDLDIYMIVAVDDFNMGAMENKGLNVFNSKFVLAQPATATDVDYEGIEAVIGHEYFHNWTGNRVTCRDWFQLTLKEGLTVFRDQEFTADMLSPSVKRIEDVKRLRSNQFPEDAGPMAHPIQPQSYIEMNNFYTMTVYEKGAEVVRLYHTLLGESGFQKGMQLYFARHDGQAVTVQDFRQAMADANAVDLAQMHNWYVQSGTPHLQVTAEYYPETKTFTLTCKQSQPQTKDFVPLLLPIGFGMLDQHGQPLILEPTFESAAHVELRSNTHAILRMTQLEQKFTFMDVSSPPVPSLLRGFSAPVKLHFEYSNADLALLAAADEDSFVRWEAMQTLLLRTIQSKVSALQSGSELALSNEVLDVAKALLEDEQLDAALVAMTLSLPELGYIGEQYQEVDVDAIYQAHHWLESQLAHGLQSQWLAAYQRCQNNGPYQYDKIQIAQRMLKNVALSYLGALPENQALVASQYQLQQNMTDVLAALRIMLVHQHAAAQDAMQDFYQRWQEDNLVVDKWFALQAQTQNAQAVETLAVLLQHSDFSLKNPNRVRSLLGVFSRLNLVGFHRADGKGYQMVSEQICLLDALNPQIAARLLAPFTHWKRYDVKRQSLMRAALQEILQREGVSKDVYEIASKSLA
ncbi:aminopeptidase N [Thiosulfatimonas sediminis]|uniref:Aminopeptidase N n=1 Tax=Thiosulfatimonas sediminis TaxID=2675054 RepID=A0A6F8PTM8_9GAMM|nr:aminopeptidase N [Thiosulfatimonas sediminis]BBP45493.1 aminopeptidase N [Thiosulfatimonas sediminis]